MMHDTPPSSRHSSTSAGAPSAMLPATPNEVMTVAAARAIADGAVCFVGIGLPSAAANLALRTHAPNAVLVYESGVIGARPDVLPLSIGDGELVDGALTVVSVPEIFAYWLQGGRIDVGFLGAAQVDRFGNLNSTVIGPYDRPITRLPGAGGAPEIAASARETVIVVRHTPRTLVAQLDFLTTVGYPSGGLSRASLSLAGGGPSKVITDLGTLTPHPETRELTLTAVHEGIAVDQVVNATGWALQVASDVRVMPPPTPNELATLRDLQARTALAHSGGKGR
jgi:glutaconate CoA-transferase, subunit B